MLLGEADRVALMGPLSTALSLAVCVLSPGPCRVAVKGYSMAPTLLPGDHLLVAPARRLRRGDLVVVRDPTLASRWVVKRVAAVAGQSVTVGDQTLTAAPGTVVVLGDNAERSTDSRDYGPVDVGDVFGRAWYRYAPAARAGLLPRR